MAESYAEEWHFHLLQPLNYDYAFADSGKPIQSY
jgi:hypothetical protein